MAAFRVDSNHYSSSFEVDADDRPDNFRADLSCGSLSASVGFYETAISGIARLFETLAADWKGWEGERTWRSLESDVALGATHNKLGTVRLKVRLRSDVYDPTEGHVWAAEASLFLDAGGLDRLANEAARLAR